MTTSTYRVETEYTGKFAILHDKIAFFSTPEEHDRAGAIVHIGLQDMACTLHKCQFIDGSIDTYTPDDFTVIRDADITSWLLSQFKTAELRRNYQFDDEVPF